MFNKFIENFINKSQCEYLIDLGESIGLDRMLSSRAKNNKIIEEGMVYEGNKRLGCYFLKDTLNLSHIKSLSDKIINLSNELNIFKGIEYTNIPKYSFNKYSAGDFLHRHSDTHEILNGATITYILQLNDDYVDGDIKYVIEGIEYAVPKKMGSVFIFDSNIPHSVDVISSGNRYSINAWPSSNKKLNIL